MEEQHKGVFAILDEACLNVGKVTDQMFLDAMSDKLSQHKHYSSRKVELYSYLIQYNVEHLCRNDESCFQACAPKLIWFIKSYSFIPI